MKSARILSLVLVLLPLFGLLVSPAIAQQSALPLILVVRDGAGSPLAGITLQILLAGPPHEPYDNCVTDAAGQCQLMLPPGAYVITFAAGWRGRAFIPAEQQNGGAASDGGYGGFGINFAQSDQAQIITFVVGQRADGMLIPLWDMSRDPNAPPQPFVVPANPLDSQDEALEDIDLGALSTEIPSGSELEALQATASAIAPGETATAQVVVSDYGLAGTPTVEATQPADQVQPSAASDPGGLPAGIVLLGLLGLLVAGAVVVLAVTLRARRQ